MIGINEAKKFHISRIYKEAKDAYIDALASIIMYPEALDYLD